MWQLPVGNLDIIYIPILPGKTNCQILSRRMSHRRYNCLKNIVKL